MAWWNIFRRKKPATPTPAPPPQPQKPPFPTALQPGQRPFSTGYKPVGPDFHADAAFTDGEEYRFLYLGQKVDCRSSWIEAAQYSEAKKELTIWASGKDYTIPDVDLRMAERFMHSTSKGMWWHSNKHRWHGG